MTDALSIALSGLSAQKQRLAATASNIANASTTGRVPDAASSAPASTVYKPLQTSFTSIPQGGVRADVTADESGYSLAYDPQSPHANSEGYIATPNVDLVREIVNLSQTKAAFRANLAVLKTEEEMMGSLLDTRA